MAYYTRYAPAGTRRQSLRYVSVAAASRRRLRWRLAAPGPGLWPVRYVLAPDRRLGASPRPGRTVRCRRAQSPAQGRAVAGPSGPRLAAAAGPAHPGAPGPGAPGGCHGDLTARQPRYRLARASGLGPGAVDYR